MVWHSCGPKIPNPVLFHELTVGKVRMCPSFVLISESPYPHHEAFSSWALKGPGKESTTSVGSEPTDEEEQVRVS